ncbi:phage tail protein [Brucellaceae bacterium D45D]
MSSIYDWSLFAASNANSDDNINWQEGQPPSTVNNSARSMMQRVKELLSDLGGITATAGTANIITFAAKSAFSAYVDGIRILFRATNTNTGPATLNANSVGAKPIFTIGITGLSGLIAGNITANGMYEVVYSSALDTGSGGWILLNPTVQSEEVGSYKFMAVPFTPDGYLYCNGQAVSRTTYSRLFNRIGVTFGAGDGSTSFSLPDWRGIFPRGWDDGRGVDSGRAFASLQGSQNAAHTHAFSGSTSASGDHTHGIMSNNNTNSGSNGLRSGDTGQGPFLSNNTQPAGNHAHSFSGTTSASGGNEARPINNTVYVVIKY